MSVPWSRRSFLRLSGNAALVTGIPSAFTLSTAGAASAAGDGFDQLRDRWREMLLGGGFDPAAAPFAGKLALLGSQAAEQRAAMAAAAGSLWPDLPLALSASITASYARLGTMAQAYAQPGTGPTGDGGLAADIMAGLDHLHQQVYNPAKSPFGNWWDFQIGSPRLLLDICTLLHGQLSPAQLAGHLAAVDRFVHDINTVGTTDPVTRRYLTLWFDHGVDPVDAACSYVLMPGATTAATVLANDNAQQGVGVAPLGVTAVNFRFAGTVGALTADGPACVLVREHGDGRATLCVSDPMRMRTALTVTWHRAVTSVLSGPAALTSATTGSALTLVFGDLTGLAGATQRTEVALG
ncbi:polysaccharide lyase beta-sandwich domain-containing protein [Streptomyces sp. 147326]|uniref:polysaccharide lyase beta-sandwich domain-containing protein n=1 Tax=Streptomyces sp. 147326 TaxID=3074379 RepID=UPI0038573A4D